MMRILTALFLLSAMFSLSAQRGEIKGYINDQNSGEKIPYASIYLLKNGVITNNGAISNEDGAFKVQNVRYGSYQMVVSFIGYKNDTLENVAVNKEEPNLDIGSLNLAPVEFALEGAEVSAMSKSVSTKIDRQKYRASDFEISKGGTAVDLLNKLPSVTVSPDGEISVRGTTDFMVYLNGKPTQLDPSMLLGQISSDNILNVDVISVPSAKYESQGKGGIINITTKTVGEEGFTISENLSGGGAPWGHSSDRYSLYKMNDYRYSGNLNISYTRKKLNLFGGFNSSVKNVNGRRVGDARIYDEESGAFKHMVASGERPEWYENYSANAGFNLSLTDNSSLAGSYFIGKRTEGRSAFYVYNNFFADENKVPISAVPVNESWIYNPNTDNRYGTFHTANLDYKLKIGEASSLNLSVLYENSGLSRELENSNYLYDPLTDMAGALQAHFTQNDDTPLKGIRLAAEYQLSMKDDQLLEIGFQPQFFTISGDFSYDTLGIISGVSADYSSLENSIDLRRNIYAGYANYSRSWEDLELMLGARVEYTDQEMNIGNPDYFSIFQRPTQSQYMVKKLDVFPTLHMSYMLGENQLIVAASRRINRPPIKNMAPFLYRRHYEVYVVGDPDLKPEYSNTAELTFDKKLNRSNVSLTGFYRGVDNAIFRVNTVYNEELVLIRSYTNSGTTSALGAEVNSNLRLSKSVKLFLGASLYNFRVQGEVFGYTEDNSSTNWSVKGTLNVALSEQVKWATDFDMQSATVTAQGRNEMFYFLNTALTYSPRSLKRWSFSLKGLDLLSSNIQGLDTRAYNESEVQIFYQETTYYRFGPIVEFSLNYSFNSNGKKINKSGSEFGTKEF